MAGITIAIATDTRQAIKGTDDIAEGFNKVADAIDDAGADSTKAGDKIERSLKDAQAETKRTADEYRQLARAQKQANADATSDFELSSREKRKLSRETIKEIGDEAKQNASETFSSFDGSAQSFVDGVQGTLGGLVSSLGPVGLAVGAAGALGIGLINGALQKGQQDSEQFKADVADLTQALIDAGNTGEVSLDRIVDNLKKLATTGDDAGVTLEKLNDLSGKTGSSFEDVARAYAGNTGALKDLVKTGEQHLANLREQQQQAQTNSDIVPGVIDGLAKQATAQSDLNDYLSQASRKADEAAKADKLYAESGAPEMEAKAQLIKNIDSAYDDAAGSVSDYVDAETGVFDVNAYIAAMEAKAAALDAYKANMQKAALSLSPDAISFLESQGEEGASQLVAAYVNGTDAQRGQLAAIWNTAGKTSADSYTDSLAKGLPSTMPGPNIVPRVDDAAARERLRQLGKAIDVDLYITARTGRGIS